MPTLGEPVQTPEQVNELLADLQWPHVAAEIDRQTRALVRDMAQRMKGKTPDQILFALMTTQPFSLAQRLQMVRTALLKHIDDVAGE